MDSKDFKVGIRLRHKNGEVVEVIEESPYQIIFEIKTSGGISQLYLEPFDEGVITKWEYMFYHGQISLNILY